MKTICRSGVRALVATLAFAAVAAIAQTSTTPNLLNTSPTADQVSRATPYCKKTTGIVQKGVVGISDPLFMYPSVDHLASGIGAKWARAEFRWDYLSPQENTFHSNITDSMVKAFYSSNINIAATIAYPPPSLTDWKVIVKYYQEFLATLVWWYKPAGAFSSRNSMGKYGISYWEIFNEPNSPGFGWFDGRTGFPYKGDQLLDAYVYMLVVSNVTIRSIDPSAVIILGGLSPDGYPPFDFLRRVYALGAKDCFDVIAFHPYAYGTNFAGAMVPLRWIAQQYGDAGKPVWFNEYGTTENPYRATALQNTINQKSIPDALFWYTLVDYNNTDGTWGVVRTDGTMKPEYPLLQQLLQ